MHHIPSKGNKRDILHDGNDVCMYYVHLIHKHYKVYHYH